jgi:hypothetical protein
MNTTPDAYVQPHSNDFGRVQVNYFWLGEGSGYAWQGKEIRRKDSFMVQAEFAEYLIEALKAFEKKKSVTKKKK